MLVPPTLLGVACMCCLHPYHASPGMLLLLHASVCTSARIDDDFFTTKT